MLPNVEIVGLITKEHKAFESEITRIANENKIPVFEALEELSDLSIDFLISIQFHEILKEEHIANAKKLAINLHLASLPEYRGCNQFSFAIVDDAKEFGTTLHRLDFSIDGGDIIAENRFQIKQSIRVDELYQITLEASIDLFKSEIERILQGNYSLIKQSSLSGRKSSVHYRSEINDLKKLDMN